MAPQVRWELVVGVSGFVKQAHDLGHHGTVEIVGLVRDVRSREHRSEPFRLDLDGDYRAS